MTDTAALSATLTPPIKVIEVNGSQDGVDWTDWLLADEASREFDVMAGRAPIYCHVGSEEIANAFVLRVNAYDGLVAQIDALKAENERLREALTLAEQGARNLNPYLVWQLSAESPGYHPTFPSAVAYFRGQFAPEVFAPGSSRFDAWQAKRARTALQEPKP